MKLRNKLIALIAPSVAIPTLAPIALVSCGETNSISYSGQTTIATTTASVDLEFTLAKELKSSEKLTITLPSIKGDYPVATIKSITGTKVIVNVALSSTPPSESTFKLAFKCVNNKTGAAWESTSPEITIKRS